MDNKKNGHSGYDALGLTPPTPESLIPHPEASFVDNVGGKKNGGMSHDEMRARKATAGHVQRTNTPKHGRPRAHNF